MIKRYLWSYIALLLMLVTLTSCDSGQSVKVDTNLSSTDLSAVSADGIWPGMVIQEVNVSSYTAADDEYEKSKNTHNFKEMRLFTNDENEIIKVYADLSYIKFSIDGSHEYENINEVIKTLGSSYKEYWFDREQGLKALTYADQENGCSASFIYFADDRRQLVWLILERL